MPPPRPRDIPHLSFELGEIVSKPIYQFMQRNTDGSLNLGMIDGTTHVRQDATPATARIETMQCVYNSASNRSKWGPCSPAETIIHVPAGSIARTFSIDATRG